MALLNPKPRAGLLQLGSIDFWSQKLSKSPAFEPCRGYGCTSVTGSFLACGGSFPDVEFAEVAE